jgi:hypothetical protein
MIDSLPIFQNVFFVHYQCEDFNIGETIFSLCIFTKGKAKEFAGDNEAENIALYCQKVKELCDEGFIPIHWNQNRSYYGCDHIISRYKSLTNKDIDLEYINEINLANLLIDVFGDEYVSHPRLDNLAELNNCNGNSQLEYRKRTFAVNRLLLISKIYHRLLNNKLVIESKAPEIHEKIYIPTEKAKTDSVLKEFSSYLYHEKREMLSEALKSEFSNEKGKSLRLMLAALEEHDPPLFVFGNRQGSKLFEAMKKHFDRYIGTYQSVIGYKIEINVDKPDVTSMKTRINHILKTIENK